MVRALRRFCDAATAAHLLAFDAVGLTRVVIDGFRNDLRRARSCLNSPILTSTGSAKAIGLIFPEVEQANRAFEEAANGPLLGILGYESRLLVSVDCVNDPRSSIVAGPSTLVIHGTQLKVYAWYDNEWRYSCRLADLASHVAVLEAR